VAIFPIAIKGYLGVFYGRPQDHNVSIFEVVGCGHIVVVVVVVSATGHCEYPVDDEDFVVHALVHASSEEERTDGVDGDGGL